MNKILSNRYEIIEKIGSGGMAIVYKAKDLLLNRIVTIKVLREQFTADEEFVRRFRREAQSAASLSHTNIVSIYDVGKDEETEYIVMEYVEGKNLKEIIRDYAPLSTEQTVELGIQIAEAIHHAHEHQIIHRDIKPHNILVTEDGRIKVTDFGIARAVTAATVTHTGDIVGSVHYLSPEQARGVQTNEQSDVYSLGIILYELLTGKVPYDGETPIAIALKHLQELPDPPSKFNPRVSLALENVVMRAIAKSPDKRYSSAQELLADLRKVKSGMPVQRMENLEEHDLESTRIHRSLSEDINLDEAIDQEKVSPQRKKTGKKPKKNWLWAILVVALLAIGGLGYGVFSWLNVGTTEVPSLVGKSVSDAEVFIRQSGLTLDPNTEEESSDTIEKGRITRTLPEEGETVKKGRAIKIWISSGPELVKMPNFKNGATTQEAAKNQLKSLGFAEENITVQLDHNSTLPEGIIIEQDPAPGSDWPKNGYVTLTASAGKVESSFSLTNVIAKSQDEAKSILEQQYNLIVITEVRDSTEYPRDVVMDMIPKPGTMVKKGDVITIVVSRGPGPIAFGPGLFFAVASSLE